MLGTRGKRIRGRVVGNKKNTETRKMVRRRWKWEKRAREGERETEDGSAREIEPTRSQGYYYSCGTGGGRERA
jgi:hypothetical protein